MNSEQQKSDYFEIHESIKEDRDGAWIGRIRFTRKDTGEECDCGKTVCANTREMLDIKLREEESSKLYAMEIPEDWGSKSRKVLVKYLRLRDQITMFGKVMDDLQSNLIQISEADDEYIKFWSNLIEETVAISKDINHLSREDRHELLLSRDKVFKNPIDPWNLDDLTGREAIFKFFLTLSKKEKKLHVEQQNRMKEAFEAR